MKYLYTIAICFACLVVNAQNLTVLDAATKQPVPYATVSFFNCGTIIGGLYSNENGIVLPEASMHYDQVKVSCIGYETIEVTKGFLTDTLFLAPQAILLNEIVISDRKDESKTMLLGMLKESKKFNFSTMSKGLELVVFIKNTSGTTPLINSFLFKVKKREKNKTAFRIHFYEKEVGKLEPGREIVLGNIIVYRDRNNSKLLEADISSYNLLLPADGIFAGIEFMGVVDDNGNFIAVEADADRDTIEFNDAVNEPLTFFKQRFSNEAWQNTASLKNDFDGLLKLKNWPNASFSLKVYR